MTDSELLFKRIRNVALSHGKSERYYKWLKDQDRSKEFHHVFTSTFGRKSTDYLGVLAVPEEHRLNQDNKDWLIEQMPGAIDNLLSYVAELESELKNV